jgi:hypothetical protein
MSSLVTKEAIGAEGPFLAEFEFSAKSLTQVCLLFLSTDRYLHIVLTETLLVFFFAGRNLISPSQNDINFLLLQ